MEEKTPTKPAPDELEAPGRRRSGVAGVVDLSAEIESAVEREPLDRVRCVHLYDDRYRGNWWAPGDAEAGTPQAEWAIRAMHRVRKSRFISARLDGGELVMRDVTPVIS